MRRIFMPLTAVTIFGFFTIASSSCDPYRYRAEPDIPDSTDGWAPIYAKTEDANAIQSVEPVPIENGGKIYVKGNHVIDISQPNHPKKLRFISIAGAQEMAIKDNMLYTNNLNDLVVVDISNVSDVKVQDRLPDVFHIIDGQKPPLSGYFICPDPSKGEVIGWEQKTIYHPECRK
jgi:hypothetical protein